MVIVQYRSDKLFTRICFRDGMCRSLKEDVAVEVDDGGYVYSFDSNLLGIFTLCTEDGICERPVLIYAFHF